MKKVNRPWTTGALLICTKCEKSISKKDPTSTESLAEGLKKYLKTKLYEQGQASEIRVMTSSCLDICKEETQAVSYCAANGKDSDQFTMDPIAEKDELLKFLQSKLAK